MPDITSHLPLLRTGRWFAQQPSEFTDGLLAMAQLRNLHAGEVLFLRDDPPCGLYALVRGAIRISGHSGGGEAARA